MKTYILITLLVAAQASATIDIQKLKENVAEKLQTLESKAATTLHQFIDSIDIEKVKMYDFLHILPLVEKKQKFIQKNIQPLVEKKQQFIQKNLQPLVDKKQRLIQKKIETLPMLVQTGADNLRFYYQKLHSLTGKDLILAFDAAPWPVLRRMDEFDD